MCTLVCVCASVCAGVFVSNIKCFVLRPAIVIMAGSYSAKGSRAAFEIQPRNQEQDIFITKSLTRAYNRGSKTLDGSASFNLGVTS